MEFCIMWEQILNIAFLSDRLLRFCCANKVLLNLNAGLVFVYLNSVSR